MCQTCTGLWRAPEVVVAAGTAIVLVNSVVHARSIFELGDTALALAFACYGVGSLLVALTMPSIVERIGVIRTMIAGVVVIAVSLAGALVVTVVPVTTGAGWIALLILWAVHGAATSLVNTPSSRLLADASTPQNRNLAYTAQFALSHALFLITYPIAGWAGAISLTFAAATPAGVGVTGAVAAVALAMISGLHAAAITSPLARRPDRHVPRGRCSRCPMASSRSSVTWSSKSV